MLKVLLTPVFYVLWKVEVEGRENIPTEGPAVLAANHQSFCDSFFLPLVVRRRVTYVAKSEYFEHWRTAWFFRAAGQIPMQRGGGDASQRALNTAMEVLDQGNLLAIYPEGTRAPDVRLHRGHTGVARLSLNCKVPIIPVGIVGTREVQPPGSRFMRPFRKVTVRFGPPVTCPEDGTATATEPPAGASTQSATRAPTPIVARTPGGLVTRSGGKAPSAGPTWSEPVIPDGGPRAPSSSSSAGSPTP